MNEMVKIQHQQWARDLDDQRRSGLTQREWCRIHGISIHTFEYRCRIVRQTMENRKRLMTGCHTHIKM